jgi:hypothetical protein
VVFLGCQAFQLGLLGSRWDGARRNEEGTDKGTRIEQERQDDCRHREPWNATDDRRAPECGAQDEEGQAPGGEEGPKTAAPGLEGVAIVVERQREGRWNRHKHEAERDIMAAREVGDAGDQREQGRERSTGHPCQASPPPRTFLYSPRAQ